MLYTEESGDMVSKSRDWDTTIADRGDVIGLGEVIANGLGGRIRCRG